MARRRRADDIERRGGWLRLVALLVVLGAGLAGFRLLVSDQPFGGEPSVVAQITSAVLSEPESSDEPAMRPAFDGGAGGAQRVNPAAPADIVIRDPTIPEGGAVLAHLVEQGQHGPLPKIGPDGEMPATAYAVEPGAETGARPMIAILVGGMGLSASATEQAIGSLPGAVTLAFAPYGRDVDRLAARARADGHEILLQVPMEPYDYPDNDPGPQTLLTGLAREQNVDRLHWSMGRLGGYVGVTNYMGARFSAKEAGMRDLLEELKSRGLVYVEDGTSQRSYAPSIAAEIGLEYGSADLVLDTLPDADSIAESLAELERIALAKGVAIGVASGLPVTVEAIASWARAGAGRGTALVPLTAAIAAQDG